MTKIKYRYFLESLVEVTKSNSTFHGVRAFIAERMCDADGNRSYHISLAKDDILNYNYWQHQNKDPLDMVENMRSHLYGPFDESDLRFVRHDVQVVLLDVGNAYLDSHGNIHRITRVSNDHGDWDDRDYHSDTGCIFDPHGILMIGETTDHTDLVRPVPTSVVPMPDQSQLN